MTGLAKSVNDATRNIRWEWMCGLDYSYSINWTHLRINSALRQQPRKVFRADKWNWYNLQ